MSESGAPVFLRGICVGGWMNLENFINGYPGGEARLRWNMARTTSSFSCMTRTACS